MINILSYVGMHMHSELCLWTLLGLVRTIFDATLFKVNANLKQVWQMSMPDDLSMPMQRALRTMISGLMLAQCFTVHVYLASYIVLLYPVFLEERPALVLPWLLLAATRKLLCELASLALGLGTCVLLGPARPPCIKFVIKKLVSIMPAFYMWMLVHGYYHALKVTAAFKTFPAVLPPSDHDFGLELAIRRRKTKSLLGEDQLRLKLIASLYEEKSSIAWDKKTYPKVSTEISSRAVDSPNLSIEETKIDADIMRPVSAISHRMSESGSYEDWYGSDVVVPRDADRIMEQFVVMMLRVYEYLRKEGTTSADFNTFRRKSSHSVLPIHDQHNSTMPEDLTDTPTYVGSSKGNTASYVREYPQIFMKRPADIPHCSENRTSSLKTVHSYGENNAAGNMINTRKRTVSILPNEKVCVDVDKITNRRVSTPENVNNRIKIKVVENGQKQIEKDKTNTSSLKMSERLQVDRQNAESNSEINPIEPGQLKDKYLSSSDSLTSIMNNFSQVSKNDNHSNQESDTEESSYNKNLQKDKQD